MWRGVPVRKPGVHVLGLVSPSLGQLISRNTNQNSSLKSHFISFQISSLKTQIQSQESDLKSQEDDLNWAKSELNRLQQEETQLEQSIQAGKVQLETIIKSLKSTQEEISQVSGGRGGAGLPPLAGVRVGWGFWGLLPSRVAATSRAVTEVCALPTSFTLGSLLGRLCSACR